MRRLALPALLGCLVLAGADAAAASPHDPVLSVHGHTLTWTPTALHNRYIAEAEPGGGVLVRGTSYAPPAQPSLRVGYRVRPEGCGRCWSNEVFIPYSGSESPPPPHEEPPPPRKERKRPPAPNTDGRVSYMSDTASWWDRYAAGFEHQTAWVNAHWQYGFAFPPYDDGYAQRYFPTQFAMYWDAFLWGPDVTTPAGREAYLAKVEEWLKLGFVGLYYDDMNFSSGFNKPSNVSQEAWNAGEAAFAEAFRTRFPTARLEINSQFWDLWPRIKEGNPDVLRVLNNTSAVFKEFGWDSATAGIGSPSAYREALEFVDWLHAHGISVSTGWDYSNANLTVETFDLATALLVSNGQDHIVYGHQHPAQTGEPEVWAPMFSDNLGASLGPRERSSSGLWSRAFTHGDAYVCEPGCTAQIVAGRELKSGEGLVVQR
jgi:hypothetical protein